LTLPAGSARGDDVGMGAPNVPSALPAAVAETHSAVLFFVGDRAYKLKKAVDLGFLDFRDRATREATAHLEVALNRRLAPDVYLGVADVTGPDGTVCDHLVVMRRMPEDRRLTTLVRGGADVDTDLWHLAHLLAAFHSTAERSPEADRAAGRDAVADRWTTNTAEMLALDHVLDPDEVLGVEALAQRYLAGRGPLFLARVADGRAVDGHGDLLADDIFCLDDGPRVLDCLEFDAALRLGDGLADVAFLAMDLERLGRADLADRFLAAYREHADDTWPASLAHHHIAYRAQVRAKVTAIRATQGHAPSVDKAARLLGLARRHLEAGAVRLVIVGGLPGTGKSTLAAGLGDRMGAVVLRTDEVRKELGGPAPTPGAGYRTGRYAPDRTAATYRELLRRARVALGQGETVVVDASFTDGAWRQEARRLAVDTHADLVELRCEVAPDVAAERIRRRMTAGSDASEATPAVAAAMAATADPWPAAHRVDTGGAPEASLADALGVALGRPGTPVGA
jgi:aminoglycoside phosphotransferase family enzyme/predicted kinase